MNSLFRLRNWFLALTISLPLLGCSSKVQTAREQLAVWTPEERLQAKLTNHIDASNTPPAFQIDMQPEYKFNADMHPFRKLYLFRSPSHKDGTFAVFMISTYPTKLGRKVPATLPESMKLSLDGIRSGRSVQWNASLLESGEIHGQQFMRAYWSGQEPIKQTLSRGFVYGTISGEQFVELAAQDFADYSNETLPTLEAATQTFKLVPLKAHH